MNHAQHNYDFRNRDFLNYRKLTPTANKDNLPKCKIDSDFEVVVVCDDSRLVDYFSGDFTRFLSKCFEIYPRVRRSRDYKKELSKKRNKIILADEKFIGENKIESEMAGAFHITVEKNSIVIIGKTERGTAQGVYYLEDKMRLYGESVVAFENAEHAPLFSPRMTHSGTELDTFPDNFMEACAHAGIDALIVYAGHPDMNLHGFVDPEGMRSDSPRGYCDYSNLVWRAEGYGLDVYVYSHLLTDVYPTDEGAEEYYEKDFGTMFKKCPKIKGMIFVGETFEFPSKDEHTCGIRSRFRPKGDTRRAPGWYPCYDYPLLINRVKDTITKYNPDVDIIFWTYNWGWAPQDARLALIENLPKDITLLVTYDMWESFTDEKTGEIYKIDDYSISFPGPSHVFLDEGAKAKEVGLRFYAMANTGGRTWDCGLAPYLPVPYQWQKRYAGLRESKTKFNLSGLMENHHFGWLPSFLSLFSKNAFMTNRLPDEEMLSQIARRDWGSEADNALTAWKYFSDGISQVIASDMDQYGPYRVGPTYPLLFDQKEEELEIPFVPWAWHQGGGIWLPIYPMNIFENHKRTLMRLDHLAKVTECYKLGCELLDSALSKIGAKSGEETARQAALAKFIYCSYVTASNLVRWTIAKQLLISKNENEERDCVKEFYDIIGLENPTVDELYLYMLSVAEDELKNLDVAFECWVEDSSIGFEASMEYSFNDIFVNWKRNETEKSIARLKKYLNK